MKSNYMGCKLQLDKQDLEAKLQVYEEDGNWVAEEKLDGMWAEVHIDRGEVTNVISRNGKEKDFPELRDYKFPTWLSGILVGEIGYGSSNARMRENLFVIYDFVRYRDSHTEFYGADLDNADRRQLLEILAPYLGDGVKLVLRELRDFYKVYQDILSLGGEGIILKQRMGADSYYQPGKRVKSCIKVKKEIEVDMVVIGVTWREGEMAEITKRKGQDKWIESIVCGQIRNGVLSDMVHVGSMTEEHRKFFTDNPKRGTVVTIKGYEQFEKTGSIRHPSLVCIREDLHPRDCQYGKVRLI